MRELETRAAALLALGGTLRVHRAVMPALLPAVRWLVFGDRVELGDAAADHRDDQVRVAAVDRRVPAVGGKDEPVGRAGPLASVPVRVLVGNRDRLTPAKCTEAIVAALPHAELQVFDSCGHMLPLECPDAVTDALADVCERIAPAR